MQVHMVFNGDCLKMIQMDKKAKDILFKTYWKSTGWINDLEHKTESADFAYAKEKGVMFDKLIVSEEDLFNRLEEVLTAVPIKKVTDAFLCSMTNKRADWRSGLASYANAERLLHKGNIHEIYYRFGEEIDINILNFERIKWGGVRHFSGLYNWLDLNLLSKEEVPLPREEDIQVMRLVLEVIERSGADEPPSSLRDRLADAFRGSRNERHTLMEILGCADILLPLKFDRKMPGKHDWRFVLHWRGEDKYNKKSVRRFFRDYGIE
jgi:hypothetical protein